MPTLEVSIPETRNADFTVYILRVMSPKGSKLSEVRYSEFFELHKKLKKIVRPYPEFPTRRFVRKHDPKVVEARRQRLEAYIQALVAQEPVHQYVLEFLGVQMDESAGDEHDGGAVRSSAAHAAALCFNWEEINKSAMEQVERGEVAEMMSHEDCIPPEKCCDNALAGMLMAMYY